MRLLLFALCWVAAVLADDHIDLFKHIGKKLRRHRSRPLDKAHAFANLRNFGKGRRDIAEDDWKDHAEQFCKMFPHHRKCRDGKRPVLGDIDSVVQAVQKRQKRRRVPRVEHRNWLSNVPSDLSERINKKLKKHMFGRANDEAHKAFKNSCRGRLSCKIQPEEALKRRKLLRDRLSNRGQTRLNKTAEDADEDAEVIFDKTLRIKRALLENANLTAEVEPIDDGVFEKDMLLTEEQANFMLNDLNKAETTGDENLSPDELDEGKPPTPKTPPPPPVDGADGTTHEGAITDTPTTSLPSTEASARAKRAGMYFEDNFAEKWDISSPIPYTFSDSIAPWDKTDIRDGLDELMSKTCIRFREVPYPSSGYHINFVKIDSPTFCGLSYIGRVNPVNTVYLSFQCGKNKGVVIHETMHALGVIHQHLRMDRDTNIKVDWTNINPQYYDQFAVADQTIFSSYGVKYDYGSVMHYNAYSNAIDISKPTMIPLINSAANLALLGQRDALSRTDIELLNKMYCKPSSCVDRNIYCGAWTLSGVCTLQGNSQWMSQNCRKSCNLC